MAPQERPNACSRGHRLSELDCEKNYCPTCKRVINIFKPVLTSRYKARDKRYSETGELIHVRHLPSQTAYLWRMRLAQLPKIRSELRRFCSACRQPALFGARQCWSCKERMQPVDLYGIPLRPDAYLDADDRVFPLRVDLPPEPQDPSTIITGDRADQPSWWPSNWQNVEPPKDWPPEGMPP